MTVNRTSQAAPGSAAANLRGIAWMLVTGLLFVGVTGVVRHLGSDMSPMQAAFIRYVFGVVLMAPVLLRRGGRARLFSGESLRSRRLGLHALRGLVHAAGVMLWFYAMARIPIAEVTALGFTAPIFTTIGAALFLGERLSAHRIGAVLIGFGGAMIILRPGFEAISTGALAQLAAAPLFATSFLITKKLTETESSASIVAHLTIFVTLALLPAALMNWRAPSWEELGWLCATAVFATLGHLALTQALRATEITVTQPFSFLQLVWATLLGFYVFDERPEIWIWIGGAVIVASASYIARRESLARRPRSGR
ncbi:MAG: DMT family transporter [Proteobacteria bacterium]|nr:DMT family transporter [Pseudomonadota bacterium]